MLVSAKPTTDMVVICNPTHDQISGLMLYLASAQIEFQVTVSQGIVMPKTQGRNTGTRKGGSLNRVILRAARGGTTRDHLRTLATRYGYNANSVSPALTTLTKSKMLKAKGDGAYEITEKGEQTIAA